MRRVFFITGTDTGVGKTVATAALGLALQKAGLSAGVLKPVLSGGDDAEFLKNILRLDDDLRLINPYFAEEPLSPHLALARAGIKFDRNKIIDCLRKLQARYDVVLVEGAGGILVPIAKNYFMADLARDLGAEVIVVARAGLGTINHSLLTIEQARQRGLAVRGIIFNQTRAGKKTIPEKTNPEIISRLSGVPVLGELPYLSKINRQSLCKRSGAGFKLSIDTGISGIAADRVLPPAAPRSSSLALRANKDLAFGVTRSANPRQGSYFEQLDKKYIWHPFTQMRDWLKEKPLVVDSARGVWLKDTDGREYIDGVSSLWVTVHGHNHPKINQALKEQIDRLEHSTMLGLANTPAVELAERLVEVAPQGLEKVFYSDNGSTAVEVAVKMAYQYWQNKGERRRTKIAHLANSYHGDTLGSVSVGGIDLFHKVYRNLIIKTMTVDFPDCYRAPKGKKYPDYAFECVDRMEKMFRRERGRIAAFVAEPIVQGAAGMIMWPKGILKRMREICRENDVLFIADEVATGFGRTGKMFACEHENISPDFMCVAKGITGGYLPLAATLTTKEVFNGFVFPYKEQKTFFHGHTYTGNPLACAAALANLKVFKEENTLVKLQPKIKYLRKRLEGFFDLPHVGDIRQRGFMVGIELVQDRATKAPFSFAERVGAKVCEKVRERGVILRPLGNVIVLMPPLSITLTELDKLLDVTRWGIEQVTRSQGHNVIRKI